MGICSIPRRSAHAPLAARSASLARPDRAIAFVCWRADTRASASATSGSRRSSRPGVARMIAFAAPDRRTRRRARLRNATVPITRTNSTARPHSRLAASTLRPLRWRRSDARRPLAGTSLFNHAFSDVYVSALSGQWVGGGFGSSRGAAAVPTSRSAGLLPSRGWAGWGSLAQTSFPRRGTRLPERVLASGSRQLNCTRRRSGRERLSGA